MMLIKLAKAVMEHAKKHYEESGWDEIVDEWTTVEIGSQLKEMGVTKEQEAIEAFEAIAAMKDERRKDTMKEAF